MILRILNERKIGVLYLKIQHLKMFKHKNYQRHQLVQWLSFILFGF